MDKGLYDDVDEICQAVHYRLSRKVLPRITEDGYVEYGLQIPHNYRAVSIPVQIPSKSKSEFGPDVEWILRGSGSTSRGSAGSVHQSLGVNGASGQLYGSAGSLQSRNTDSSGSKTGSGTSTGGTKRRLERSESFSGSGSEWNRKMPIPQIRHPDDSRGKSVSPPTSRIHEGQLRRRSFSENEFRNLENVINEDELEELGKKKF